jgi:hypothetical protein
MLAASAGAVPSSASPRSPARSARHASGSSGERRDSTQVLSAREQPTGGASLPGRITGSAGRPALAGRSSASAISRLPGRAGGQAAAVEEGRDAVLGQPRAHPPRLVGIGAALGEEDGGAAHPLRAASAARIEPIQMPSLAG